MASTPTQVKMDIKETKNAKKSSTSYSFDFIKEKIKEKTMKSLECEVLSSFCAKLQLKTSGTKETLIERLSPLKDEALFEKRISFIDKKFQFKTSLPRANVPSATACWKFDATLFPKIGQVDIDNYQEHKRQGRKGEYRKAYRMFQSRRVKHIKVLKRDGHIIYVKASVLKSFSSDVTRTVTVLFEGNIPRKAFCECPVGACGLCCHAILVLLQLKHFNEHKNFLLALTCTQKLQKWHRPSISEKARAKAKSASHIRLKYLRNTRSARKLISHTRSKRKIEKSSTSKSTNDTDASDWFVRDVSNISYKVQDKIKQSQANANISNHFFKCLNKYKISSGLNQHLDYKTAYLCRIIQREHDYTTHSVCYNEAVLTPKFKGKAEDIWHSVLQFSDTKAVETVTDVSKINSESLFSTDKTKDLLSLLSQSSDNITVKLPKYENANTIGCSNYVDIAQGSPEWFTHRIGMITASKLPALLGMNGHREFDTAWFCIKLDETFVTS